MTGPCLELFAHNAWPTKFGQVKTVAIYLLQAKLEDEKAA